MSERGSEGAGGRPRFYLPLCCVCVCVRPSPSSLRGLGASQQPPASSRYLLGLSGGYRGSWRGSWGRVGPWGCRFPPRRDEGSVSVWVCVHEGNYLMSVLSRRGAGGFLHAPFHASSSVSSKRGAKGVEKWGKNASGWLGHPNPWGWAINPPSLSPSFPCWAV